MDIVLGDDTSAQTPVTMDVTQRTYHTLIVGKSGMGKSTLMLNMMIQDMQQGRGFLLIEPGNLVESVKKHVPRNRHTDVVLIDSAKTDKPFGLNLFARPENPDHIGQAAESVAKAFATVWPGQYAGTAEKWLKIIATTFMEAGEGTVMEIPSVLHDPQYRDRLLKKLTNYYALTQYRSQTQKDGSLNPREVGALETRLSTFLLNPMMINIVGQETSLPWRSLIDRNAIVLVSLPFEPLGKEMIRVLGTVLIQQFFQAALRLRTPPTLFSLYADEFQYFAAPDFEDLISQARKYSIGVVMATQQFAKVPGFLQSGVRGVSTTVLFRLDADDSRLFGRDLQLSWEPYTIVRTPVGGAFGSMVRAQADVKQYANPEVQELFDRFRRYLPGEGLRYPYGGDAWKALWHDPDLAHGAAVYFAAIAEHTIGIVLRQEVNAEGQLVQRDGANPEAVNALWRLSYAVAQGNPVTHITHPDVVAFESLAVGAGGVDRMPPSQWLPRLNAFTAIILELIPALRAIKPATVEWVPNPEPPAARDVLTRLERGIAVVDLSTEARMLTTRPEPPRVRQTPDFVALGRPRAEVEEEIRGRILTPREPLLPDAPPKPRRQIRREPV